MSIERKSVITFMRERNALLSKQNELRFYRDATNSHSFLRFSMATHPQNTEGQNNNVLGFEK